MVALASLASACSVAPQDVAFNSGSQFASTSELAPIPDEPPTTASASADAAELGDTATSATQPTTQPAVALASSERAAPADGTRFLKRLDAIHRGEEDEAFRAPYHSGSTLCASRNIVQADTAIEERRERWTHDRSDQLVEYWVHVFSTADEAAQYAATAGEQAVSCLEDEAERERSFDPTGPELKYTVTPVDVADWDLDPDRYVGVRVEYFETVQWFVATQHHELGIRMQLTLADPAGPTEWELEDWRELLQVADQALNQPLLTASQYSDDETSARFEDVMLFTFKHRVWDFDGDALDCLADVIDTHRENHGKPPSFVIIEYMGRWCAPSLYAAQAAERDPSAGINIADADKRLCFAETVLDAFVQGDVNTAVLRMADGIERYSPERIALDAQLAAVCDIGETEGIVAGLDPRVPLDDSPEREPFCTDWQKRVERSAGTNESPLQKDIANYEYIVEIESTITAPPELVDAWQVRRDWYQNLTALMSSTQMPLVDLYGHPEYEAMKDEQDPDGNRRQVTEYLRINCHANRPDCTSGIHQVFVQDPSRFC